MRLNHHESTSLMPKLSDELNAEILHAHQHMLHKKVWASRVQVDQVLQKKTTFLVIFGNLNFSSQQWLVVCP